MTLSFDCAEDFTHDLILRSLQKSGRHSCVMDFPPKKDLVLLLCWGLLLVLC